MCCFVAIPGVSVGRDSTPPGPQRDDRLSRPSDAIASSRRSTRLPLRPDLAQSLPPASPRLHARGRCSGLYDAARHLSVILRSYIDHPYGMGTGEPSRNFKPGWSVKRHLMLPALTVDVSIICGFGSSLLSSADHMAVILRDRRRRPMRIEVLQIRLRDHADDALRPRDRRRQHQPADRRRCQSAGQPLATLRMDAPVESPE
jgi:hypothetical protein